MKKLTILFLAIFCSTNIFAQDIIIKDVNIIPMTSNIVIENQSILIQSGKITEIGEFLNLPQNENTKIIIGKGKYLMPGLADMHVHLHEEEKIENLLISSIAAGVTHIRIMNSDVSQTDLRKKLNEKTDLISPEIHYSHLIRRSDTLTESQADSLMGQIKADGISFVKLLSLSDEQTFDHLIKSANKHNLIIGGHYPVYQHEGKRKMVDMEKVIKGNYKSIEHLAGYIWLEKDEIDNVLKLTKDYNIYNCPTLDWDIMSGNLQYPDEYKNRITYQILPETITKDWESNYLSHIEKAGGKEKVIELRDERFPDFELKLNILKRLYENDCLLLIGGDAGTHFQADGFNIYEEMINWRNAGIDNYTILKSATVTPSLFFNEQDKWGTIEVGKNAEMIILSENPLLDIKNITTIETTIIREEIYNNRDLINKL